jgi:ABC-type lipoprotein release transport system permease subunit
MRPLILALAWRQLAGNPRRTALTLAAVATGLAALGFLWSLSEGLHRNMVGNFQDAIVGSFQVHRRGFFHHPELARHLDRPEEVVRVLEASGVSRWTWRLEAFGLAAGPTGSAGVLVIGVDPAREPLATGLASRVGAGRFLVDDDARACVLGAGLAAAVGARLGDPVALMVHDRFGALVAEELQLTGILTSGEMGLDRGLALVPLDLWQGLLEMEGRVTSVVARVEPQAVKAAVAAVTAGLADDEVDVLPWHAMFPALHEWVSLSRGFHLVLLGVVLVIVLAGVLNTVLLSTLERTRELGALMALGMRAGEVGQMVAAEALLLGVLGALAGIAAGLALVVVTHRSGIDLGPLLGESRRFYLDPRVRPVLAAGPWLVGGGTAVLAALLAGTYPAWVASRLEPAEAMRHA